MLRISSCCPRVDVDAPVEEEDAHCARPMPPTTAARAASDTMLGKTSLNGARITTAPRASITVAIVLAPSTATHTRDLTLPADTHARVFQRARRQHLRVCDRPTESNNEREFMCERD